MGVSSLLRLYLYRRSVSAFLWLWTALTFFVALAMIWSAGYVWFRWLLAVAVFGNVAILMVLNLAIDALRRYRDYLRWKADLFWNWRMLGFQCVCGMAIGYLLLFREEYIWLVPPLMCGSAAYMWDVAPALSRLGRSVSFGGPARPSVADIGLLKSVGKRLGFDVTGEELHGGNTGTSMIR
jgi:hypothetical protein